MGVRFPGKRSSGDPILVAGLDDPQTETAKPVVAEFAAVLPSPGERLPTFARRGLQILPLILLASAIWVLWREFHHLRLEAVAAAMSAWGLGSIAAALGLSAVSFALMGVVEWVGLRWAGAQLPWGAALSGSLVANAIAHSIGANLLVSGAVRARLYDRYGVTLTQVAATTLFGGISFAVGLAALSGAGLLLAAPHDLAATAISLPVARRLGALLTAAAAAYVALCALRRKPITAFGHSLTLPSFPDALAQLVIGVVDNGIAAAILWILLPTGAVGYPTFIGAYAVACAAGLASSIPGGAGVFESALAALLSGLDHALLAAAFLGYRLSYYLLPLIIASTALAADTLRRRR